MMSLRGGHARRQKTDACPRPLGGGWCFCLFPRVNRRHRLWLCAPPHSGRIEGIERVHSSNESPPWFLRQQARGRCLFLFALWSRTRCRGASFSSHKDHSVLLHPPHSIPASPTPLRTAGCPATHARGGAMHHLNPARRYHGEHGVSLLPFLRPPPTLSPVHSSSPLSLALDPDTEGDGDDVLEGIPPLPLLKPAISLGASAPGVCKLCPHRPWKCAPSSGRPKQASAFPPHPSRGRQYNAPPSGSDESRAREEEGGEPAGRAIISWVSG